MNELGNAFGCSGSCRPAAGKMPAAVAGNAAARGTLALLPTELLGLPSLAELLDAPSTRATPPSDLLADLRREEGA